MKNLAQKFASMLPQRVAIGAFNAYSLAKSAVVHGDIWMFQIVHMEIATRCNRGCWYCPEKFKTSPTESMSYEVFDTAMRHLQDMGWSGLVAYHITNEPLLSKNLERHIKTTVAYLPKSVPTLFTNGDALTVERMQSLVDAGLMRCTVTKHEPYKDGWDERIAEVVKAFPKIVRLNIVDKTKLINVAGMIPDAGAKMFKGCYAPTIALPIRTNGDVAPCCCDYDRTVKFGNVLENSLKEIWEVSAVKRKLLRKGKNLWPICEGCSKASFAWANPIK